MNYNNIDVYKNLMDENFKKMDRRKTVYYLDDLLIINEDLKRCREDAWEENKNEEIDNEYDELLDDLRDRIYDTIDIIEEFI